MSGPGIEGFPTFDPILERRGLIVDMGADDEEVTTRLINEIADRSDELRTLVLAILEPRTGLPAGYSWAYFRPESIDFPQYVYDGKLAAGWIINDAVDDDGNAITCSVSEYFDELEEISQERELLIIVDNHPPPGSVDIRICTNDEITKNDERVSYYADDYTLGSGGDTMFFISAAQKDEEKDEWSSEFTPIFIIQDDDPDNVVLQLENFTNTTPVNAEVRFHSKPPRKIYPLGRLEYLLDQLDAINSALQLLYETAGTQPDKCGTKVKIINQDARNKQ